MAFDELKESTDNLQQNSKEFVQNQLAYYKLLGFKIAVKSTAVFLNIILIVLALGLFVFFVSIALAFALSNLLGSYAYGFLAVGGIYLLFVGLVLLVKDKVIEGAIVQKFSDIFFTQK